MLALTFSQPQPNVEFYATPHYCLRQLGVIDQHARRGGRQYRQFAAALERLAAVRYQNQAFYDPVRREHRRVSFGFFSYSLPLRARSSRAWRIVWDPLFFDLIAAIGGHMRFDIETYRGLDPASRRLFLLLTKMFRRRSQTPAFDLRYLGVQVLGFAPTIATRDLKIKVTRCIKKLAEREMVDHSDPKEAFHHTTAGAVTVHLERGRYFGRRQGIARKPASIESPLFEPLRAIGVTDTAIPRLLKTYPVRLIQEWLDITLAAEERFGPKFFRKSAAAYFVDNVRNAAAGVRTPPDWWRELHRAERHASARRDKPKTEKRATVPEAMQDPAVLAQELTESLREGLEALGQPREVATRNAERFSHEYCQAAGANGDDRIERLLQMLT